MVVESYVNKDVIKVVIQFYNIIDITEDDILYKEIDKSSKKMEYSNILLNKKIDSKNISDMKMRYDDDDGNLLILLFNKNMKKFGYVVYNLWGSKYIDSIGIDNKTLYLYDGYTKPNENIINSIDEIILLLYKLNNLNEKYFNLKHMSSEIKIIQNIILSIKKIYINISYLNEDDLKWMNSVFQIINFIYNINLLYMYFNEFNIKLKNRIKKSLENININFVNKFNNNDNSDVIYLNNLYIEYQMKMKEWRVINEK